MSSSRVLALSIALVALCIGAGGCRELPERLARRAVQLLSTTPNVHERLEDLRESHQACNSSESIGLPWKGQLRCGHLLAAHPRLRQVTTSQYGTDETVNALTAVADALDEVDPGGPALQVMDLSRRQGGPLRGHRSHQSGRDVDLRYLYLGKRQPKRGFHDISLERLDGRRTWLVVDALMKTRRVQLMFMDTEVQALVFEAAKKQGVRRSRLRRLFQYPRRSKVRRGVIRHYPNHRSHLHVRFKCPRRSVRCRR